ncbi:MAG: ParA family protein [Magnetococcales bacterium]|nr:ParA family protein [Magnetococcales bacterium]
MGAIVAIANQKGGVGKTSTAVNLAATWANLGKRILLVDLDPQGNATTAFGVDKKSLQRSIYQVLAGRCRASEAVVVPFDPQPHLIPATADLSGAEVELVGEIAREQRLKEALATVADDYDLIIIDCPPSLGLLTLNALVAANRVLIPMPCEFLPMEGLSQLWKILGIVQARLNPQLTVAGILFTMFDPRVNLTRQVAEEVRRHFPNQVLNTVIPRNVRVSEAQSFGQPLIRFDHRAKASVSYQSLAGELAPLLLAG